MCIRDRTLSFHHGKHLQAYVDNLNKLLPGSEFEGMALEEIVRKAPAGPVFNNAGQILNHELYFTQFRPVGEASQGPDGALAAQIEKQWGSVEAFKAEFEAKSKVSDSEVLAAARQKSHDIVARAEDRTREMYRVANEYTEDALRRTEEAIQAAILDYVDKQK